MAFALRTEIEIAAPADRIWSILTDFAAYPSWNPFVVSISGALQLQERLVVKMRPPGGSAMTFKPHVSKLSPGSAFAWRGSLPIPGLFGGEHSFELSALGPDKVRLVHSEQFSGVLVPLLQKSLNGATRKGFEAMNEALKARAESASA
jgi:hypothetical protein